MAASIYLRLGGGVDEVPINIPKVDSETPIIIRLCPEFGGKSYKEGRGLYFNKEKGINCMPGGGGG